MSIVQPLERWNERLPTSSDNFVSDVSTKGYLTREEALKYPPLTDLQNVVSMKRSLVKILSKFEYTASNSLEHVTFQMTTY